MLASAGPAGAVPCTGTPVGNASTDDVTLGGFDSDACHISAGVNPQAGPSGDTSGFDPVPFGTGWDLLVKDGGAGTAGSATITIGFSLSDGTWSVTSNQTGAIDLVFAVHAGHNAGQFLFDNESLTANVTKNGTWEIEWLNPGGQVPGFSNLTVFYRDADYTTVPLPNTLALLGFALAGLGFSRRRKAALSST
jgi:PEP-CTERM motif